MSLTVEEMKQIKKKIGFTNSKLSMVSGVPIGTVNKILSGDTKNPSHKTMDALERALLGADYKSESYYKEDMLREAVLYGAKADDNQGDYTIDDYRKLPDDRRGELIDGVFYDLAAPTTGHQRESLFLTWQIMNYITANHGACEVFHAPVDVKLDPDNKTMVQPDILIVCDPDKVKEWGIDGAPDFVIEIISPSTKSRDMFLKARKYKDAGVKEYWIVDLEKERVLVYIFDETVKEDIKIYGLEDEIPVWIYGGDLKLNLKGPGKRA